MTDSHAVSVAGRLPRADSVRRAGFFDTLAIFADVLIPTIAKGPIIRRPRVMAIAERFDLDRRAIRRMQRIRNNYGAGPLLLRFPGRSLAMVLDPEDVHRVLAQTPEPFAAATREKRAALAHFEPRGVLLSQGAERADRRRYNEAVLESERPVHELGEAFLRVVDYEADRLYNRMRFVGELGWADFSPAWLRIVRRIVFGDGARNDNEISALMFQLRSRANWAFLRRQDPQLREQLLRRIRWHVDRAEPNSLAAVMEETEATAQTAPEQQVPQWLFAFDPAGMATFRSLALLASHPEAGRKARAEIGTHTGAARQNMPFLRATVLESLRLWPTTPLVLRETTTETTWENGVMPANTGVIIFTPFFHRDDERLGYANHFSPELWTGEQTPGNAALIPFSEGPAVCPGRNLVLMLSSAMLAALLERWRVRLKAPARLRAGEPLPATLNHYGLRFELRNVTA